MSSRYLLIFIFILAFVSGLHSQETQIDVVYMNNGTFLRGNIVEMLPGKSLKISVLNTKDTLEILMNDVKLIRKESFPENTNPDYEDGIKVWGYTNITELTFGSGLFEGLDRYWNSPQKQFSLQLSTVNGATISPYIQLGFGTGLEFWKGRGFIPLYLDFRTNILKKKNTPFGYVDAGYSPGWMKGEKGCGFGGALIGLGAGAKIKISKKVGMVFSLGYRFQQTRQWQENYHVRSKAIRDAHFMNFRTGLIF